MLKFIRQTFKNLFSKKSSTPEKTTRPAKNPNKKRNNKKKSGQNQQSRKDQDKRKKSDNYSDRPKKEQHQKKQHPKSKNRRRNDDNYRQDRPPRRGNQNRRRKSYEGNQENHPPVLAPKKEIPPMPEIIEAPVEEGKTRFTDLPLNKELHASTQDLGFQYCTPIQQLSLPHTLKGKDITGKAQTGTGKTAAFLLSLMDYLLKNPSDKRYPGTTRSLILTPTRELAIQVAKDAEKLAKYTNLNIQVFFGGMHHDKQRRSLQKPIDILIGTPGRLIDYVKSRNLFLQDAEVLVIDEADRMLDMGFIPDVRFLVRSMPSPHQRHTMFFSATFDQKIMRLVNSWLNEPVNVEIESEEVVTDLISQHFYSVMAKDKFNFLRNYLSYEEYERVIIFVNRKDTGYSLHRSLKAKEIHADLLSGDVPQHKRIKVLERLRSGEVKILIATDVAARGIHINNISHVINYDLPDKTEDYVHRIGRTGRAGRKGNAMSLVCESGAYSIGDIEKYVGDTFKCELPPAELLM